MNTKTYFIAVEHDSTDCIPSPDCNTDTYEYQVDGPETGCIQTERGYITVFQVCEEAYQAWIDNEWHSIKSIICQIKDREDDRYHANARREVYDRVRSQVTALKRSQEGFTADVPIFGKEIAVALEMEVRNRLDEWQDYAVQVPPSGFYAVAIEDYNEESPEYVGVPLGFTFPYGVSCYQREEYIPASAIKPEFDGDTIRWVDYYQDEDVRNGEQPVNSEEVTHWREEVPVRLFRDRYVGRRFVIFAKRNSDAEITSQSLSELLNRAKHDGVSYYDVVEALRVCNVKINGVNTIQDIRAEMGILLQE
jgi:hypothetical protein